MRDRPSFLRQYLRPSARLSILLAGAFLLSASLHCTACDRDPEHVFAFVRNDKGQHALGPANAHKYETARRVFDKLVSARGDFRQPAPAFVMNNGEMYVAWMNPRQLAIGLEEKAFDICMAMGPDSITALAALLAHELVHYYEKHDWNRHFAQHNQDLQTAHSLGHMDEGLKQEAQADYLGGFLAHTAGYPVSGIMPTLLQKLYLGYGLPAELRGYPSLSERVVMAHNAQTRLSELLLVFETAGLLTLTGQYVDAVDYYRYLAADFPAREIYNNAGANLLQAALNLYPPSEMTYVLPVEWDPETRLRGTKSVNADRELIRTELIKDALDQFERARLMDPAYSPAYLNQACAFLLLGETEDAAYWLRQGRRAAHHYNETHYDVADGIRYAIENDHAKAIVALQRAGDSPLAAINLALLQGQTPSLTTPATPQGSDIIEGVQLARYLQNPLTDLEVDLGKGIFTAQRNLKHSRILLHYADNGVRYGVYHLCEGECAELTRAGIGRGATLASVMDVYGPATSLLPLTTGYQIAYPASRLFFTFDRDKTLRSWGSYRLANSTM
jgi:tetratricopeptide (TPR) repeat protein